MTEVLRVDTGLVRDAGGRLRGIAADIPEPPPVYRPTGADALSAAIAAKVTEVVDPVLAQMPVTKEELTKYALNVVDAANTYDTVDGQLAEEILKRLELLDGAARTGGASSSASPTQGVGHQPTQVAQLSEAARTGDEQATPGTTSEPARDQSAPGDGRERVPDTALAPNPLRPAEGGPEITL